MVSQNSSAALQRQMQNIRGNLVAHADEAVKAARAKFAWRHYVSNHPWISMGAAMAVGYLLVPRRVCCRAGNAEAVSDTADRVARMVHPSPLAGVVAGVLSALAAAIARDGLLLVTHSLQDLFESHGESGGNPVENTDSRLEAQPACSPGGLAGVTGPGS
jgi:hypothetical protein